MVVGGDMGCCVGVRTGVGGGWGRGRYATNEADRKYDSGSSHDNCISHSSDRSSSGSGSSSSSSSSSSSNNI